MTAGIESELPSTAPPSAPSLGVFDECFSASGEVRPHWQTLISSLDRLDRDELGVPLENSRRILSEHGVTCFVNRGGDGGGAEEPWQLDLLPLILGCEEWRALESGLIQRARLLNLVLRDCYGTQRLVRDGFLLPPLVFANPGYLRSCQAIHVQGGAYLQIYAADLARSTDGRWWVLADRTQAPAGLGFALENRSILSRVLPEAMRAVQPRPIADTLRVQRDTLCRFAPQRTDNPSIVLRTSEVLSDFTFAVSETENYSGTAVVTTVLNTGAVTVCEANLADGWNETDLFAARKCNPAALTVQANDTRAVGPFPPSSAHDPTSQSSPRRCS
jgi:uncharacterized circularly permuted ATP-grasp superfamily protein